MPRQPAKAPLPNVTYAVGGVAIMAGGNIIGGIGVSGAPGGQFDEECARAGLAKIARCCPAGRIGLCPPMSTRRRGVMWNW
jgi:hypothetical protein